MAAPGAVSAIEAGLRCRCPRCGEGRLYRGLLTVQATCPHCDLDLSAQDTGDGAAVFAILIVGAVAVAAALVVELTWSPPSWLHLVYQIPLVLGGSIVLLRPLKATLIALQFRHRGDDFRA